MKRRHDKEADADANGIDRALGQTQRKKRLFEYGGHGRLSQPTNGKRRERDAKLASRKIGVYVLGDSLGGACAGLLLFDGELDLRLADTYQGEFCDDEEGVHQEEKDDEQNADHGKHFCCAAP